MIQLTCTQCRTLLEMDDAFAGGVCRCQHCGTIQTVPAHLKPAPSAPQPAPARGHYQGRSGNDIVTSGLDELADVVASSGLGSGLHHRRAAPPPAALARSGSKASKSSLKSNPTLFILIGAAAVIVLLLVIILWMYMHMGSPPTNPAATGAPANESAAAGESSSGGSSPTVASGPAFFGIPISGSKIVYVLDQGSAMRTTFDALAASVDQSLNSLGSGRQFAIVFWKRSNEELTDFPKNGLASATRNQIDQSRQVLENVQPSGLTQVDEAIREAAARHPDTIFIATSKGASLDESALSAVTNAVAGQGIHVSTLALGDDNGSPVLKEIARKTGGIYREISTAVLRQ